MTTKTPKNVLVADWWDRSPCIWICDLSKLDETDPIQAQYKKVVTEAIADMEPFNDGRQWMVAGQTEVPDDVSWTNGRPDQVEHAVVMPPCTIDAYIILHYPR